ncbi:MAG TPA: hypothetical protein VK203_25180 [Nostocaceae cyanobacterium]|nr:hypothetical protein [Nostocaceae cyanobacterium]
MIPFTAEAIQSLSANNLLDEKGTEEFKMLILAQEYMLQALDDKNNITQAKKIYQGLLNLSRVVEKYMSSLPEKFIEKAQKAMLAILADTSLQLEEVDTLEELNNYVLAIKNTARSILWQIENYQKQKKHTVGELLTWLKTAPTWSGDDFEECLEYVNHVRK